MNTFNKEELHSLLIIAGGTYYQTKNDKAFWDNLTKNLFTEQPELINLYDEFINKYLKTNIPITHFSDLFQNKIIIGNLIEASFNKHYSYRGENRTNFFKKIAEKEPDFLNLLHSYIKNNLQLSDFDVYDTYFQLLKSKKIDKSSLNNKEILDNIDSFYVDRDSAHFKKKINAYLNTFPRDKNLYQHIIEKNGWFMNNCASLRNVWEEKIELFPIEVVEEYRKSKTLFNVAKESEGIYYSFEINHEYIVEYAKIKNDDALQITNWLQTTLSNFILENVSCKKIPNNQNNGINFVFQDVETKDQVKEFCSNIKNDINTLLQPKFLKLSFNDFNSEVNLYFSRLFLATKLNESLSEKESSNKQKNKI